MVWESVPDLHRYFMFNKTGAQDFSVFNRLLSFVPLPFSLFFPVFLLLAGAVWRYTVPASQTVLMDLRICL